MNAWKKFRYRLEYASTLAAAAALQRCRLETAQGLGRGVGSIAYALGVARKAALDNLAERMGDVPEARRREIARAAYRNFAQTFAEIAWSPSLKPEELDRLFRFEGLERLEEARAAGKGIVCMSAHFGNWEWMGAALIRRGIPVTFLIGTQSNPHVDKLFNDYRARMGIQFVRIHAIRDALKVLKGRGMVALLGDQDGDRWGTYAPFFGVPASTHSIGELLARRSGSLLAFGVPVRLGPRSHHLKVEIIPEAPQGLSEIQATAWTLTEYNRLLEAAIREHPDQWLWMHHRWRSKAFHRIAGEDRAKAERGEIVFDTAVQVWRDAHSGAEVAVEAKH
jgi:KDO2-lipid IV(A) lauroyltransferase